MKLVNYCLKHPFATSRMGVMTGSQVVDLASAQTELKETGVIAGDTAPIAAAPAVFYTDAALHIKLAAEVYAQLVRYKPKCMFHRSEVKLLTPIPQPQDYLYRYQLCRPCERNGQRDASISSAILQVYECDDWSRRCYS